MRESDDKSHNNGIGERKDVGQIWLSHVHFPVTVVA